MSDAETTLTALEQLGVVFTQRSYLLATGETIGLDDMLGLPVEDWGASFVAVWPLGLAEPSPDGFVENNRRRFLSDPAFRRAIEDAYLDRQEREDADDRDWDAPDVA